MSSRTWDGLLNLQLAAEIWILVDARLHLYHISHLGRIFDVKLHKKTSH